MATDVEICNLALTRVGHAVITEISASGNRASKLCAVHYEPIKKSLLREHPWNFAVKRDVLVRDEILDITNITRANPAVVTSAGHGFANGAVVYIAAVRGMNEINNRTYTVANTATNTFQLSGVDSSAYTAYASGGALYGYVATDYAYRFPLPTDCLKLLVFNKDEYDEYRVEGRFIYTNEGTAQIEYIYDVTDEELFDSQFVDIFAQRIAAEIAYPLTENATTTEQAWRIYQDKIRMARTMDAREGTPRGINADTWLNVRV